MGSPWLRNDARVLAQKAARPQPSADRLNLFLFVGSATSTTNVGRFSLSEPSRSDHEPTHGRPETMLPVCMWQMAGS